jgi:uncharacterized protein
MNVVGTVESLWRYPVKSMRGQELKSAFAGFAGIYGDRIYAFHDAAARASFPYLTAREKEQMLLYQPRFRDAEKASKPDQQHQADAPPPGSTPLNASTGELMVDVQTPAGGSFAIDDPELTQSLCEGLHERHHLRLFRSQRALTDCRPVSLISTQTAQQIGKDIAAKVDKRRFRANIYLDLSSGQGFGEDQLVGRSVRIGAKAVLAVLERDPRCKMITLDPDTAEPNPEIMRRVARSYDGKAGVYAAVMVEGTVCTGDEVCLLD